MTDIVNEINAEWAKQRPDLDVKPMEVMGRILVLSKLLETTANETLKPYNLMFTELHVLANLRRMGKPYQLSPKQLIKYVQITSGSMTACLDKLEKKELIHRVIDPEDKRGRLVGLSKKGFKVIDAAIEDWFSSVKNITKGLSTSEHKSLAKLLNHLICSQASE